MHLREIFVYLINPVLHFSPIYEAKYSLCVFPKVFSKSLS